MRQNLESRVLIVDDNPLIHDDFRKVLRSTRAGVAELNELESLMFDTQADEPAQQYHLDFAYQGEEALDLARRALAEGKPYRLAFVDMRMPPGWDGLRTMIELKQLDPNLQFVVCSAYSDYDCDEVSRRMGIAGSVLHLAKPFSPADIRQIAFILGTQGDAAFC